MESLRELMTRGNSALKRLPDGVVKSLVILLNSIVSFRTFPSIRKRADVVMIPKLGKDRKLTRSYKPISLLPNLSKVAETVILSRLCDAISERNFLAD